MSLLAHTGSLEAESALERMIRQLNEGFTGGKVTKHDLLSWIVIYFERACVNECSERIRQDHFDQLAYLESVLKEAKRARRSGEGTPDIAQLLSPLTKASKSERPRGKQLKLDDASLAGGSVA